MRVNSEAFTKTIVCPYCGELYAKQGYGNHIAAHEREYERQMYTECVDCGKKFITPRGLKIHRGKMHGEPIELTVLEFEPEVNGHGQEETFPSPQDLRATGQVISGFSGLSIDPARPSIERVNALHNLLYNAFNTPALGVRKELLRILITEIDKEISLAQ